MKRIATAMRDKGSALLGIGVMIPGSFTAELVGGLGFDWALIDLQHGANSWDTTLATVQGLELGGTPALVRVGWPNPQDIMRALDLGAQAVVVPMVKGVADARLAAAAAKYPPVGERSMGLVRQAYGIPDQADDSLCFVMVETVSALAEVEAIAAVPGIDGIFLGPGDMSLSMGLPRSRDIGPEIEAATAAVVEACRRHGKIAGAFAPSLQALEVFRGLKVQLIVVGTDVQLLLTGAQAMQEAVGLVARGAASAEVADA